MPIHQKDSGSPHHLKHNNLQKKKWLTLGAVGIALLIIPRRSSRKDRDYIDNATIEAQTSLLANKNKES